ncbi:MAG: metallophosphoesterase family protein [Bacteroidota bacterium]
MKRLLQIILIILSSFYLVSCNADPKGLVSSSDVDKRFEDNSILPEKKDVVLAMGEDEFSFIVVADTHVYHGDASALAALKDRLNQDGENDKFLLACGDISQCGKAEDYQAFKDALEPEYPVYPAIGNHDLYFDGWHNYREILGRSCYTFKAGEVLFVSFDSANGTLGRKQKNWLEGVLKNKSESLVVVFTHFEFFSPNTTTIQQYTDIEEAYYLVHLFKETGVDYVFMGHSHDYYDKEINGTHYVNVSGFADDHEYLRVKVNRSNGLISYERKSL